MIALDLGSNTLRAVKINSQTLKREWQFERVVKTALDIEKEKKITTQAVVRILKAIEELKSEQDIDLDNLVAVTTEAFRRAKNAKEILKIIQKESGILFKIIDGDEEAYYTLLGVKRVLSENSESFVLVDIGGGSTEVIFSNKESSFSKSFPIGILSVFQKYKTKENISANLNPIFEEVVEFTKDMRALGIKYKQFVATAGTPTTVAAMKFGMTYDNYDYKKINNQKLEIGDLDSALLRLSKLKQKEREKLVGTGRYELILTGILLFKELFEIFKTDSCTVIDDGLREGVAIAHIEKLAF